MTIDVVNPWVLLPLTQTNVWEVVDIGALIGGLPADASGVDLWTYNTSGSNRQYGASPGDSTDDRQDYMRGNSWIWAPCGLGDINTTTIKVWRNNAGIEVYLTAVRRTGFEWVQNGLRIDSGAPVGSWMNLDINPGGVFTGTPTGGLMYVQSSPDETLGYRHGANVTRNVLGDTRELFFFEAGCNGLSEIGFYRTSSNMRFYTRGITTAGVTWYENPVRHTFSAANVEEDAPAPATAVQAATELVDSANGGTEYSLRGSDETFPAARTWPNDYQCQRGHGGGSARVVSSAFKARSNNITNMPWVDTHGWYEGGVAPVGGVAPKAFHQMQQRRPG